MKATVWQYKNRIKHSGFFKLKNTLNGAETGGVETMIALLKKNAEEGLRLEKEKMPNIGNNDV